MSIFYTDSASFNNLEVSSSVIISGSFTLSGSLDIKGNINSTAGLTGSLLGTASWANNSKTSSFINPLIQDVKITGSLIINDGTYESINTSTRALVDDVGIIAINWQTSNAGVERTLFDDNGLDSVKWNMRKLFDESGNVSIDWGNVGDGTPRNLKDSDGVSTILNWDTSTAEGAWFSGSLIGTASWANNVISSSYATTASYVTTPAFIDNLITVGLTGSSVTYNSIKSAVDSITDASQNNTYLVKVSPGIYIEDTINMKSWITVKGDSSISTVVSASNPSASIFVMADQSMIIDMHIQGSTAPSASAIYYSSPTTPQTNAIAYVENVRFGTNYTNATCEGSGSGNCILQCSNVKYGGFTDASLKSFDIGFRVTGSGGSIGRMQLRNVTSTNGGVAGTDNNQIFALADAPGCTFIVNGCLLTRATGTARGTGFKIYNGGQLRLTGVNFQRWINGIWAPQTGSAPSIDAIALNFENCTTDLLIEHTGSIGKVQGTDNFLKTQISLSSSLYEVGQDPRRITVGSKGADFTSISASVAYITDSSDSNRYIIEVGPGRYVEKEINLTGKPYISIIGSSIQTTQIFPSSSNQHLVRMGVNNEISFLSLTNSPAGYSALYIDDIGDFAQAHKISFYDCDTCISVISSTQDTLFYGEYIDFNGVYSTGSFISSSNGYRALASLENYYQFPVGSPNLIANYAIGGTSEIDIYAAGLIGEQESNSAAIRLENGADMQGTGIDITGWGTAVYIPNTANSSSFNIVGTMIHNSVNYDFNILHPSASCRFQGTSDQSKINNASSNFFWSFLDENNGELNITRKLAVTFIDGTHTDASTLIFEGSPMGVMSGGTITISGSLTITTAAGYGYLNNVGTDVYQRIDWVNSNLTLSPNTDNYIYINETSTLSAAATQPDSVNNIILGRVVTNTTGVELVDNSPYFATHMSNALSKFNRNALGSVFADGCIVSEDATPLQLDVTAGAYYFGENEYNPTGGSAITFTRYFQSGSGAFGWNKSSQTLVLNNQYNSGSALIAMSASYFTKHTLYTVGKGPDEEYFLVVGQDQYATLIETENADLPSPPTYFSDGVVSLSSIYVQSGSANIVEIQDIRPIIGFRAAGINASSVHGNLLGLTADDHQQYLLVNGTRDMGGNLNMGGYNITNFTSILGSSITASLFGTSTSASYVLQAVSASYATTSSYALTAQTLLGSAVSASYAQTASYVSNAVSSSFATTASFTPNALVTASVSLNTITFTKGDGSTFPITVNTGSGGGGTPGGSDTEIQYNNAGTFGGVSTLKYNGTTLRATGSFTGSFTGNGSALTGIVASTAPGGQDKSVQFNDAGSTSGSANFTFDKTTNKVSVTGSIQATEFSNTTKTSGSSAAAGNYITTQYLTGDVTNSTVNLAAGMTTTNVVAGTYQFKYVVRYQSAATTTGIGLAADHTGTATYWVSSFWFVSTGGTASTGVADQIAATNTGQMVEGKSERVKGTSTSATAGVDTLNADMLAVMEGIMEVSTSGDLQLEFKSEIATSIVTLKAGTCLILTKLS